MSSSPTPNKNEMPIAQSLSLLSLVNYQEGAVASRTLVKRPNATITLFAFDESQGLSEHTTLLDAFVHILEGEAEITISGKPHTAKTGEAILLPANQPHAVRALCKFKMLLTMARD